jgi:hypothetical protein
MEILLILKFPYAISIAKVECEGHPLVKTKCQLKAITLVRAD